MTLDSLTAEVQKLIDLADREGLHDAAAWFAAWQRSYRRADRYRSLAGDFWNLAHEAVSALGAWSEDEQDWRVERIEDEDNRILAIRLSLLIEDYDKLTAEDRRQP